MDDDPGFAHRPLRKGLIPPLTSPFESVGMPVCPLDFRYGRPEMKAVFDEENRLQTLLDVEAALAQAQAKVGNIK